MRYLFAIALLIVAVITANPAFSARPYEIEHAPSQQSNQATADILRTVDAPGRDLAALTQRLKLGGRDDIPEMVNAQQPDYRVGTQHRFYVADVVKNGYFTINATVRHVTPHAYWYVQDGYKVDQKALVASANRFETRIYPTNRRIFGNEANPGVDNDPRITILIAPTPGIGGYFSTADTYPKIVNPFSNERDMIYLSSVPTARTGDANNYFEATLAHEFQHMIQWNVHPDRDVWLDEGCSEISMFVNGYSTGGAERAFFRNTDTQLNAWAQPPDSSAHYGASYLFLRYLMDRYGGEQFISTMLKQPGLSTQVIDATVRKAGNTGGFDAAFKDWTVANVLNDRTLASGRYSYSQGGQAQAARTLQRYPATRTESVHQHAADYIKLSGNLGKAKITFKGNSTISVIGTPPHGGQSFWYSNRRDSGDATLTREVDLTQLQKATLQFWTWYDIEDFFDLAYAEVSTDGGKSWATLKGKYTTTDNPNGTSFGNGWTGKSGIGTKGTGPARWVEESLDLTPYAGKKVLLRFEYVTDEGYNAPGFAIDDIRIPELGFIDGAESDTGWNAQGFVRIGGQVPQKWFVALVEKGKTNRVREMVVNVSGIGTLDLSGLGPSKSVRDAILVVVPLAPKTTETATYTITVR